MFFGVNIFTAYTLACNLPFNCAYSYIYSFINPNIHSFINSLSPPHTHTHTHTHTGISLIVALVLLPVSFGSDFFKQFCGDQAAIYYRGQCTIDWAMFVAMVVTACTLYLPSLAIFSMNVSDGLQAHICC